MQNAVGGTERLEAEPWTSAEESSCAFKFNYLDNFGSFGGRISDKTSLRMQNARLVLNNVRHPWRRRSIRLPINGPVFALRFR